MYYHRTTLYRMLDAFLRHKWLFVITAVTILGFVIAFTVLRPVSYSTTYTVLVNGRQIESPLGGTVTEDQWSEVSRIVTYMQAMVSNKAFMQSALTDSVGDPIKLEKPINLNDDGMIQGIGRDITISNDGADSFSVSMVYGDADDSVAILKGVIDQCILRDAQTKAAYYTQQKIFISKQVDHYQTLLNQSETRLADFRRENESHMPGQSESTESTLISLKAQAADLQIQIATASDRISQYEKQLAITDKTEITRTTTLATDSPLKARLLDLQQQLDEALQTMTPDHPVVIDIQSRIAAVKHLMAQEAKNGPKQNTDVEPNPLYQGLNNQLIETQIDQKALVRQLDEVNGQIGTTTENAMAIPTTDKELAELSRDYSIYSQTYATLKNQLQVATLNEEINLRHTTEQYNPMLTAEPQSSGGGKKVITMYLGGLFLALFLASALVLLVEWSDRSFRDPSDIERVLNVPVLAVLPEIEAPRGPADVNRQLLPEPEEGPGSKRPQKLLRKPAATAGASAASSAPIAPAAPSQVGWSPFRNASDNSAEDPRS